MKASIKSADNKLVIKKVKNSKTLKELFKNYKGVYRGEENSNYVSNKMEEINKKYNLTFHRGSK